MALNRNTKQLEKDRNHRASDNPLAEDLDAVLSRTKYLWDDIRKGRLFITGGTGFFGCWLLESFLWANDQLGLQARATVLTRNPEAYAKRCPHLAAHPAIQLLSGDISRFEFPNGRFTHVIHAASMTNQHARENPIEALETAWNGNLRVLEFVKRSGAKKLLFVSSGAVYGPCIGRRTALKEEDGVSSLPAGPDSAYGEAKRLGELVWLLQAAQSSLEVKIARGFTFLGPYLPLNSHYAAAQFLSAALAGREIVVHGGERVVRSYMYGADLAVWLWTILFRGVSSRAYNVGSEQPVTVKQLARTIAREFKPPIKVVEAAISDEPQKLNYYVPDTSRARKELGLKVNVPLSEAIRRTLRWHNMTSGPNATS
jgi:dTDP-glucose 4,6-dehydratase